MRFWFYGQTIVRNSDARFAFTFKVITDDRMILLQGTAALIPNRSDNITSTPQFDEIKRWLANLQ